MRGTQQTDGRPEESGEVGWGDATETQGDGVLVGRNGLGVGCGGRAEVKVPPSGRRNRAEERVAAATEANDFAANTILLSSELKGDERGGKELGSGGSGGVQPNRSEKEMDVAGAERLGRGRLAGIFAGAQKEKEAKANHVGKRGGDGVGSSVGLSHDMSEYRNGDGFHALGG